MSGVTKERVGVEEKVEPRVKGIDLPTEEELRDQEAARMAEEMERWFWATEPRPGLSDRNRYCPECAAPGMELEGVGWICSAVWVSSKTIYRI